MRNVVTVQRDKTGKMRLRFEIFHKFTGDKHESLLFQTWKEFKKELTLDQRRREVDKIVDAVATKIQSLTKV